MKLAVANDMLHIVESGALRKVRSDFGSDPIRTLLEESIDLVGLYDLAEPPQPFDAENMVFAPPIAQPTKIVCIGLNYLDHIRESGSELPDEVISFTKHPSSLIGSGTPIVLDATLSERVDYEIELGVVFGRRCSDVAAEDAESVIGGYTIGNDISARDIQMEEGQWGRAKSFDSFCPLGPYFVTPDEVSDPHQLRLRTELSGRVVQQSTTAEMIVRIPELIAHVTRGTTFKVGDILLTGTPWGTGAFRTPPLFLTPGDVLKCTIEGLGLLTNPVISK